MASTDPWWVEPALVVGGFVGTGLAALTAAFRKPKEESQSGGTARVLAASFVDHTAMTQLTDALVQLKDPLIELNGHMRKEAQFRHDERIAKDAAAHALLEARLGKT